MRIFARLISRCLLLVMLATVFSPSFGREVGAAFAAHEAAHALHEMPMLHGQGHEDLAAADVGCDGCPEHASAGHHEADREQPVSGDVDHHCCPGHMLGHLPGLALDSRFILPLSGSAAVDGPSSRFSSRVPEGLERPPRAAA